MPAGATVNVALLRYGPRGPSPRSSGAVVVLSVTLGSAPPRVAPQPAVDRPLNAYVAPHANAAQTEDRFASADMSSEKQTIARLLQEALMKQGVRVVTDPRLADVVLTPTTESHRNSRGALLMDAKYTVRAEARGALVDSFSLRYEMDFERMTSRDLARQDREHAQAMAEAIVGSPAVRQLVR